MSEQLRQTARAVCDRWGTHDWMNIEDTSELIRRLRLALDYDAARAAEPTDAELEEAADIMMNTHGYTGDVREMLWDAWGALVDARANFATSPPPGTAARAAEPVRPIVSTKKASSLFAKLKRLRDQSTTASVEDGWKIEAEIDAIIKQGMGLPILAASPTPPTGTSQGEGTS